MKDSQRREAFDYTVGKYIKANNERFSTPASRTIDDI